MIAKILVVLFPLLLVAQPAATDDYYVVLLRRNPARKPISKEEGERIQTAHMANIHSMADRGILVAAGPFDDKPPSISGIFFFKTDSLEDARRIAAEDPTVAEHRNSADVFTWRGPKGLGEEYKRLHKEDPNTPEGMGVHPLYMLHRTAIWQHDSSAAKAHAAHVKELATAGKLAASGPVTAGAADGLAELLIFNRISDEEAAKLAAADPAVKAGELRLEPHRWWSAAHVLPR